MSHEKNKKIILSGGGTSGSVAPLLGIVDELRRQKHIEASKFWSGQAGEGDDFKKMSDSEIEFVWLGTKYGIEKQMVEAEDIKFIALSGGKFRRYFCWQNFIDLFKIVFGFFQSLVILGKEKPKLAMSAGSFVSVPVAWAAWLLKIPVMIHQQDVRPGLANRLMAPFAKAITVTFERSLSDYGQKAVLVGNSVRREIKQNKLSPREARQKLGLSSARMPVVLVMGGGTGAKAINDILERSLDKLSKFCQIIHITGQNKYSQINERYAENNPNYRFFEFLDSFGMIKSFAAADVVVTRAGMSTLTELSYLGKPAIIIPLPGTHQELNAKIFKDKLAAIVLDQAGLESDEFIGNIKEVILNESMRRKMANNIKFVIKHDANQAIAALAKKFL